MCSQLKMSTFLMVACSSEAAGALHTALLKCVSHVLLFAACQEATLLRPLVATIVLTSVCGKQLEAAPRMQAANHADRYNLCITVCLLVAMGRSHID